MQKCGIDILHVVGDDSDPNWSDVRIRDRPKYLREQYWIKQWSGNRWLCPDFVNFKGSSQLRIADLGRSLNDPGDAFSDTLWSNSKGFVSLRTWVEATEVHLPGQNAYDVNHFIRQYNRLRGKGEIDASEFLRSIDLSPPDVRLQCDMADHVISAVEKKARKGCEGGSYSSLVRDYGRGALIVGLPLWFATFPSTLTDPSSALTDFCTRLQFNFEGIQRSVLRANWCPFDSVVVLWSPTLESINSWAKVADPSFYSDPTNVTFRKPISVLLAYSFLKAHDLSNLGFNINARWDRYPSINAMLADQRRRFRFSNAPRPLGPKSRLKIFETKNRTTHNNRIWLFQVCLFVRLHGWRGLRRWIVGRISLVRIYSRWSLRYRARELFTARTE